LGGITFDNAVAGFRAPLPPDTELFILDYRGTGRSSRLTCPSEEDWAGSLAPPLVKQCFAEIETKMPPADLYEYNTTETAMDVGMLAGALHTAGSQIIVQSGSFGTFVAHRYLHLFPEQPDAVVLDSVVLPDGTTNFDRNRDAAVRTLLGLCAMNSECKAHLGADPVAFAEGVVARLGQGHCPSLASAGVDLAVFQFLAGRAVELEPWLLPALYYRADRCDPADVTALVKYWGPPPPPSPPAPQDPSSVLKSDPLALLVQRSELTNETTFDDGTALTLAGTGTSDFYHSIWDALPAYPRDAFWGEWAHTDAPILVLQGELDIRTPRGSGEAARDHLANGRLQFVSFPWKGHAPSTVEGSCGQSLDAKFIANPTAALDTSCTLQAKPPSFSGDSTAQFGQADVWDNATP
jgi:pimeloyl-ACP methyl ester carboxylesterase